MSPIDKLKSVLCGPDGKCCIAGSDEDRAIIDRALQALDQPGVEAADFTDDQLTAIYKRANGEDTGKAQPLTTQRIFAAMRAMLSAAPQPQQPVRQPVAWWKQYPDGNVSVVEGKVFLTEDALCCGWRPLGFADAAPQAQQPAPPADVPMLTYQELVDAHPVLYGLGDDDIEFSRNVEKLVHQKAGLKCTT